MVKLDLGCGSRKSDGFLGVDISPDVGADFVLDLRVTPWPWENESVEEVVCSHFFEHLSGPERIPFMNELWRVMRKGAKATFTTPEASSDRSIQDPTHAWPPVCAQSYLYFNAQWMRDNKLEHYGIRADFDYGYGYVLDGDVQVRAQEYQLHAAKHWRNFAADLVVTLIRR